MQHQLQQINDSISALKSRSPQKSQSPYNYLTKDSNLSGYVAWDVDGRVGDMESQFKELKAMVNTTLTERKGQDDAIAIAKTRGTLLHVAYGLC